MFKLELSEQSLNQNLRQISNSNHKIKDKHLNAIRPYIKDRKNSNSKRQKTNHVSPLQMKSKGKKSGGNSRRIEESVSSKQLSEIYGQLISLKAEYKSLKYSYNLMLKEKDQMTARQVKEAILYQEQAKQLQKSRKETQKYRHNVSFLQQEMERIRKECFKLLETEKFKNKKLQETIQEKQLMIAFLRSQLSGNSEHHSMQNPFFFQNTAPTFNYETPSTISAINHSAISNIPEIDLPKQILKQEQGPEDDSLSFSRDKSKDYESIQSVNQQGVLSFTKKDLIVLDNDDDEEVVQRRQDNLPTFEDRSSFPQNIDPNPISHGLKQEINKSKLNSKRLQIWTDDVSSLQVKQGSLQIKKKKNKKKSSVKKRKSEQVPNFRKKQ